MKIALDCKSPLMQKSLEIFLQDYISSVINCDIIIRDEPCLENDKCFYISSDKNADLVKPFSKIQLISALEKKYKIINKDFVEPNHSEESNVEIDVKLDVDADLDFNILEKRIASLTSQYQADILKAVKAFYEK
jgi:hypothetical protein